MNLEKRRQMDIPPIRPKSNTGSYQTTGPTSSSVGSPGSSATGQHIQEERKSGMMEGITVKMTAKGKYYWDIQAYGELGQSLTQKVVDMNNNLKNAFPENTTVPEEND